MVGMAHPVKGESEQLLAFLDACREGVRLTAHGLTDEQVRLKPTASSLSLAGLIKHTAWTERGWIAMAKQEELPDRPDYLAEFEPTEDESLASLMTQSTQVGEETRAAVAELGLAHTFPNPKGVPWFPADVGEWDVRWLLMHLIEELARHAGHADIIREQIDSRTMGDILAELAGWTLPEWA